VSGRGLTRRDFARVLAVSLAAGILPAACRTEGPDASEPDERFAFRPGEPLPWRNWAGNQACLPARRAAPETEEALAALLPRIPEPVRPVGTGHSFSALVPSEGTLLASDFLSGVRDADAARLEAEVWAGTRLHALGPLLDQRRQAMPNLPDIDYQTLGGALATSTHGTGRGFGSLSSTVVGLVLATPAGELLECDPERNAEVFQAARCSLGALGVLTRVRLRNQKPVRLVEVSRFEPLEDVLADAPARRDRHRHFEFYAFPHTSQALSIATDETDTETHPAAPEDPQAVYRLRDLYRRVGGFPAVGDVLYDWLVRVSTGDAPTERAGPSYAVLTHPRLVRFREMEYTLPAEAGPACLREILGTIRRERIPVVFPIEYRYVRRDDVWLSMFHERDGCSISVHQYADQAPGAYFAAMERIFWKYDGRPHWGKLHSLTAPRLAALYPRWRDFLEVRRELDPAGRFLNPHLRSVLGA
jgi:FAD-linked oxidoreductase